MKTWFITGTSKGFGRVWAEAALERGDQVVATARNLDSIAPLTQAYPDTALALALDVTDQDAVLAAVRQAKERFGRIDVLINNAGIFEPKPFLEIADAEWRRFFEVNVMSGIRLSRAYGAGMVERAADRIAGLADDIGAIAHDKADRAEARARAAEAETEAIAPATATADDGIAPR